MISMSDCKVRFVKVNEHHGYKINLCRIEFLHNDKVVPIEVDGFLRIEMREINDDFPYVDMWLSYEIKDGFPIVSLTSKMLSKVNNTLFKIYVYYPDENERSEETSIQRLDCALNEDDFKTKYSANDILDAVANMDTDIVTTFNTLTDFGLCVCDDYGHMKNSGVILKEFACKLKTLMA